MAIDERQKNFLKYFLKSGPIFIFQWLLIALAADWYGYFSFPTSGILLGIVLAAAGTYSLWKPEKLLHEAAMCGDIEAAKKALNCGKVNITNIFGETALHYACGYASKEMLSFLLKNGAELDALSSTREVPLHWAVASGVIQKVEALIHAGVELDIKDDLGRTPLYWAVSRNLLDVVPLLISHGADINTKSSSGKALIEIAEENKYEKMAKLLKEFSSTLPLD